MIYTNSKVKQSNGPGVTQDYFYHQQGKKKQNQEAGSHLQGRAEPISQESREDPTPRAQQPKGTTDSKVD